MMNNKNTMFEMYFKRYKNLVIRAVMKKSQDYQLAQEICQQVFCSFYFHIDEIDEDLVKVWLLKTTRNALVDYLRKPSTRNEVILANDPQENGNTLTYTVVDYCEDKVINQDLTGRILKEVKAANELWYEVLLLICVYGMSREEAAKRLQVSDQVLRARLYRARKFVRERFGDEYWNN